MAVLADITKGGRKAEAHRPWPRFTVGERGLASRRRTRWSRRAPLCSASGATRSKCISLCSKSRRPTSPSSPLNAPTASFPPSGSRIPPAIRLERAIRDLYGLKPAGAADTRVWLDLGFWGVSQPLGANKKSRKAQHGLRLLARGGRGSAPDPGRARACRHHRARPFPLHRQRRGGGAAGRAARLCA